VTSIGYEDYYGNLRPKKKVYRGSFKSLSEKGIRIKDYTVRGGDGRPIREEED
jgi:hypothetical protein